MRRLLISLVLVFAIVAAWRFIPRVGQAAGAEERPGVGVAVGGAPGEKAVLTAPAAAAAPGAGAADVAVDAEAPSVDAPAAVEDVAPTLRRLRVVSELDREPLEGVTVRMVGPKAKGHSGWVTSELGEIEVPSLDALRCRFSLDGFVAKNVGKIGTLEGVPIEVVLRPLAQLHGRVAVALPLYTPTAKYVDIHRRHGPKTGVLGEVELNVDRRRPFEEGTESNFRGVLSATRRMQDEAREVQDDGTWRLYLEIPPEINALHGIVVEHVGEGGRRTVGTVAKIEPGESIEVLDTWGSAEPLNLQFVSADGAALSPELRFEFRRQSPEGFEERIGPFKLDSDGRVPGVTLALGSWSYAGARRFSREPAHIEGVIEHRDDSEQVIVLPAGGPLTVSLARRKGRPERNLRIGLVRAGQPVFSPRYINDGEEVVFPFVPSQGAWELVVLKRGKEGRNRSIVGTSKAVVIMPDANLVEVQRLPISVDQRRIELTPP